MKLYKCTFEFYIAAKAPADAVNTAYSCCEQDSFEVTEVCDAELFNQAVIAAKAVYSTGGNWCHVGMMLKTLLAGTPAEKYLGQVHHNVELVMGSTDYDRTSTTDEEDYSSNMPCDTYGPLACTTSCPRYFECQG